MARKKYDEEFEQIKKERQRQYQREYQFKKRMEWYEKNGLRYVKGLHPDSMAYKLYIGVKYEEKRWTVKKWASHFKITVLHLRSMLNHIRRRGFNIHPYKTREYGEGVLVDAEENAEEFYEIEGRLKKYQSNPAILRAASRFENLLNNHPEEYKQVQSIAEDLLLLALGAKKKVEQYANNGDRNKQTKAR